jgi:hypothetical protein
MHIDPSDEAYWFPWQTEILPLTVNHFNAEIASNFPTLTTPFINDRFRI